MSPAPAAVLPVHQWANFGINFGLLAVGLLIGTCIVYFSRKLIRRYSWQGYPHLLVAIDAGLVIAGTIVTSGLELWRKPVWTDFEVYTASGYVLMGVLIAVGVGSK
jgi:cytochrome c biogenesis protein CcdA